MMARPELAALTDVGSYRRGLAYARNGQVRSITHDLTGHVVTATVSGSEREPYQVRVEYQLGRTGVIVAFESECSCPVELDCKHGVAALLTALNQGATSAPSVQPWEQNLRSLLPHNESNGTPNELGVAFELALPTGTTAGRLTVRPVRRGVNGKWVRTGASWSDLEYNRYRGSFDERQAAALVALRDSLLPRGYYGSVPQLDLVADCRAGTLAALSEVARTGTILVPPAGWDAVAVADQVASWSVDVRDDRRDLWLHAAFRVGDDSFGIDRALLLGRPAGALAFWSGQQRPGGVLTIAGLRPPVDEEQRRFVTAGLTRIPEVGRQVFLERYLVELTDRFTVTSADGSFRVPKAQPPVLALRTAPLSDLRLGVEWSWLYRRGEIERRVQPAEPPDERRDLATERRLAELVGQVWKPDGPQFAPQILAGRDAIAFSEVLTELRAIEGLEIEQDAPLPIYQELTGPPRVSLGNSSPGSDTDWFDLTIAITVDGREIPAAALISALATGQDVLMLADGSWLSLDSPQLAELTELVASARALADKPGNTVQVDRFALGWWEQLLALGVVDEQAAEWLRRVRGLLDEIGQPAAEVPSTVAATLRPYQVLGFGWLDVLRRNKLGGILADDMGLGKTLQALAMIAAAREAEPDAPPFLVVAPTSVTGNWATEAAKFTPGLAVAVIAETEKRRGVSLREAVGNADLVVTSYTLFRLEYEQYERLGVCGLLLDEAQALKNHQSKAFSCAKRLPAPFKVAITGTPMENNLMELWAMFAITAPGLLGRPERFTEYFRAPIEKSGDGDRLAQLRRRIGPLMLRRTKQAVATDLPDKQEQVLQIPLEPAHRKVYDRYLQRERQKVLGLLGDMNGNRFEILRSLTVLRQLSLDASLVDPDHSAVPSSKINVLLELLTEAVAEDHRVLVFSQFTGYLALIRARLEAAGIRYSYLDGKTRHRGAVIDEFKSGAGSVFLISLKAGGVGLNLTEADYCVLMDPWWNPAAEAQAVDRAHRIGQTRSVMVYRLVAADTIEDKVLALSRRKAELFHSVIDAAGTGSAALSADDIRALLG